MGIIHADDNSFQKIVIESELPVVVDFWADWCMPCKMFGPIFEKVSMDFLGKVNFVKVDTEKGQDVSSRHDIMSIPCVIFFNEGKEIGREVGMLSEGALLDKVKEVFNLG